MQKSLHAKRIPFAAKSRFPRHPHEFREIPFKPKSRLPRAWNIPNLGAPALPRNYSERKTLYSSPARERRLPAQTPVHKGNYPRDTGLGPLTGTPSRKYARPRGPRIYTTISSSMRALANRRKQGALLRPRLALPVRRLSRRSGFSWTDFPANY